MFMQVLQIFQRRKSDANKQDFENKLDLTCQAQSTPKTTWILTKVVCTSGLNLVVLAWTGDVLSRGQAQNVVNFDFEVKFDLEGQGQSTQNNRDLDQGLLHLWSKFGDPSWHGWWVIARTSSRLTHGRTHTQTDAGNDNTRRPKLASGKTLSTLLAYYEWCPSAVTFQRCFMVSLTSASTQCWDAIIPMWRHRNGWSMESTTQFQANDNNYPELNVNLCFHERKINLPVLTYFCELPMITVFVLSYVNV